MKREEKDRVVNGLFLVKSLLFFIGVRCSRMLYLNFVGSIQW